MLPAAGENNCYEYLKACTEIYDDVYMMQHFGVKYLRSEVFADIDSLSAYFQRELKLKRGDVYTVFMPTAVQSIIAFYALNQIGVTVNMVHPLMSSEFLRETIENVDSKGIMVLDILSKKHVKTINDSGLPCLVCCSSDYSKGIKHLGARVGETAVKTIFPKFKRGTYYRDAIKMHRFCEPVHGCCDNMAVYLNGGGTTGKSRTIKLTSRAINEFVSRVSVLDEIREPGEEAEIIVLPLFHCFGLCLAVHMAACNSARLIPMMQFDARLFNRLMKRNRIIAIMGIPAMFRKLMNEKHFDGPWLKNVRLMFCGGDDVSESFLEQFNTYFEKWGAEGRLRQGYGLTEAASACCTNTNKDNRPGSIGKPLKGVRIEIWDENRRKLPAGEIGELAIAGPTIMSGYYTKDGPEDLGLYTDAEGTKWVLSGDLGYIDEDGYIFFSGRKKRVIIISGYNVYPSDIEKKLAEELSFIRECCAVQGWQGEKPIVRLYVSLNRQGDTDEYRKQIIRTCENNFSKFYVPREILFLDKLPQTPLMKIDFMKLTQPNSHSPAFNIKY